MLLRCSAAESTRCRTPHQKHYPFGLPTAHRLKSEPNRTEPKKKATQVSLSKNAKNPDVCFRSRPDCWSIEARKIQTAGSQESFDSAFERICATHHSSPSVPR